LASFQICGSVYWIHALRDQLRVQRASAGIDRHWIIADNNTCRSIGKASRIDSEGVLTQSPHSQ
jgi:hypothetical protein